MADSIFPETHLPDRQRQPGEGQAGYARPASLREQEHQRAFDGLRDVLTKLRAKYPNYVIIFDAKGKLKLAKGEASEVAKFWTDLQDANERVARHVKDANQEKQYFSFSSEVIAELNG